MSKVTEWYPASVKPVHRGEYDCLYNFSIDKPRRLYWNGFEWINPLTRRRSPFGWSGDQWRGLAEKPA